jgi:hypothetical protein
MGSLDLKFGIHTHIWRESRGKAWGEEGSFEQVEFVVIGVVGIDFQLHVVALDMNP